MTPNVDKASAERKPVQRQSYNVGLKAAQTLYYAEEQAEHIGFPLNVSITINFALLRVGLSKAGTVFGRLRNLRFAKWVTRPSTNYSTWSAPPTYTYGFENSQNGIPYKDPKGPHNVHVHWVIHVPPTRFHDFEGQLNDWLTEINGTPDWPNNALKVNRITHAGKAARYPLKGASESVASRYGVSPEKVAAQGVIIGKRTGTSLNVGPSARRIMDAKRGVRRVRPR